MKLLQDERRKQRMYLKDSKRSLVLEKTSKNNTK